MSIRSYLTFSQGMGPTDLTGQLASEVLARYLEQEAAKLRQEPDRAKYFRPSWWIEQSAHPSPSSGWVRYPIEPDGRLGTMEANWDSRD